jgi:hypothetical protein
MMLFSDKGDFRDVQVFDHRGDNVTDSIRKLDTSNAVAYCYGTSGKDTVSAVSAEGWSYSVAGGPKVSLTASTQPNA